MKYIILYGIYTGVIEITDGKTALTIIATTLIALTIGKLHAYTNRTTI